jgi:hypothetical protein
VSVVDLGDQQVPIENMGGLTNGDDRRDVARLARSEQGKRAAAFATANILSSFLENGTPTAQAKAAEVIGEIANNLEGAPAMTQPAPALVQPEPEPAPVVVEAPTDYELPADLAALLDEPDEIPDEPEAAAEVEEVDDEYTDPQVAQLRKELEKERRKTEHERRLRVQTARKDWEAEADRVFRLGDVPLLTAEELASIQADSHRGFLREAKELADRNKVIAQRFHQPAAPASPVEVRAQAETWGAPPAAGPVADATSVGQQERLAKARRSGNLSQILKAHMFPDQE